MEVGSVLIRTLDLCSDCGEKYAAAAPALGEGVSLRRRDGTEKQGVCPNCLTRGTVSTWEVERPRPGLGRAIDRAVMWVGFVLVALLASWCGFGRGL